MDVLGLYEIGDIKEITPLENTSGNRLHHIVSQKGEFVLKQVEQEENFKRELLFTQFFQNAGLLPAGYLVSTKKNEDGVVWDGKFFVLFKFLAGQNLLDKILEGSVSLSDVKELAQGLSLLHEKLNGLELSSTYKKPFAAQGLLDKPSCLSDEEIHRMKKQVFSLITSFHDDEKVIHGDINVHNVLFSDTVYFIDIDSLRRGNRMEDLARVVLWLLVKDRSLALDRFDLFCSHYSGVDKEQLVTLIKLEACYLYLLFHLQEEDAVVASLRKKHPDFFADFSQVYTQIMEIEKYI